MMEQAEDEREFIVRVIGSNLETRTAILRLLWEAKKRFGIDYRIEGWWKE